MGESAEQTVANDIASGFCCAHCGVYFGNPHGYPVLCIDCYDEETSKERAGLPRAIEPEL
jgi:hypothetical protein